MAHADGGGDARQKPRATSMHKDDLTHTRDVVHSDIGNVARRYQRSSPLEAAELAASPTDAPAPGPKGQAEARGLTRPAAWRAFIWL